MNKKATIGERIRRVRENYKDSQPELAKALGVSITAVGNWELRGAVPDGNKLNKILLRYPDINARWLITGEGQMLIQDENEIVKDYLKYLPGQKSHHELLDKVEKLSEEVKATKLLFDELVKLMTETSNTLMKTMKQEGEDVFE